MDQHASAKVLVLDFGAQYGQLTARRVRDLNVYSEIVPCDISADEIREMNASALILSGGPASVYAEDAPSIDPAIFDLGLPVLGFCYGHQITAVTLGGKGQHSFRKRIARRSGRAVEIQIRIQPPTQSAVRKIAAKLHDGAGQQGLVEILVDGHGEHSFPQWATYNLIVTQSGWGVKPRFGKNGEFLPKNLAN